MTDRTRAEEETLAMMAEIWGEFREEQMAHLLLIERAVAAVDGPGLDTDTRRQAEREAHQLAGSVGTFGFMEASRLAKEVELLLRSGADLAGEEGQRLVGLVVDLRAEMDKTR